MNNIALSYGSAAWLVICGVVASWFFLKQDLGAVAVDLPALPKLSIAEATEREDLSVLERAELAFAAGRITRPAGDSALYYFSQKLTEEPNNEIAMQGMQRVTAYLVSSAETAYRRENVNAARDLAEQALKISSSNLAAQSILQRLAAQDQIAALMRQARDQLSAGNLTRPKNGNALASYRSILEIDPNNTEAQQGIELVAQRLTSLAQQEAFADRTERAQQLIELAQSIAPQASGIRAAQDLIAEWQNVAKDQALRDDLMAAAAAAQAGRLTAQDQPGVLGALDLYQAALRKDADSEAALGGITHVGMSLVDRAWQQMSANNLAAARSTLATTAEISTIAERHADAMQELAFLERRAANRNGEFSEADFVAISQLTLKRRVEPKLPEGVRGGVVELRFTVNEDGEVQDTTITDADNDELAAAVKQTVERWRFDPYLVEGRALPVRTGMRMRVQEE